MTVPALTTEAAVRELLDLNANGSSRFTSQQIGSNIRTASARLEKETGRIFRDEPDLTLTFTTNGKALIDIPGLRTAQTVNLNSTGLTADSSYWLLPDKQQSGVFTGLQVRPFSRGSGSGWYLGIPDWWDRNLDSPYWTVGPGSGSLPNDLSVRGAWGFTDSTLPYDVRQGATALAAFLCLRSDALLSGARATENGIFDMSQWPIEAQAVIVDWKIGSQAVGVGN